MKCRLSQKSWPWAWAWAWAGREGRRISVGPMGEADDLWAQTWLRGLARGQQSARPWGHHFILRLCVMEPLSVSPLGS